MWCAGCMYIANLSQQSQTIDTFIKGIKDWFKHCNYLDVFTQPKQIMIEQKRGFEHLIESCEEMNIENTKVMKNLAEKTVEWTKID